jgi:hypothetical protein
MLALRSCSSSCCRSIYHLLLATTALTKQPHTHID